MQILVIEYARDVLGIKDADSAEFNPLTKNPVIDLMEAQKKVTQKGATMRLGAYKCKLTEGTRTAKLYGASEISERHRHRFEFNNSYKKALTDAGLVIAGVNPEADLVEIVEVKDHPWMTGVQFHPEFQSKPSKPHPLFLDFVAAAIEKAKK